MITLKEFHQDFLQSILSDTQTRGITKPQAFFENVCEELITTGDLSNNYTEAEYTKKGLEVYGYDYDEEREILTLLAHQFFQEEEIQTLTKNHIDTKFKRLKSFFIKSSQELYKNMEPGFEHYSMAYNIYNYLNNDSIRKIRLMLISDGKVTRSLLDIKNEQLSDSLEIEFRVIDIEYLYKVYLSDNSGGDFEIEVNIPTLTVDSVSNEYRSFLTILNGNKLVEIYDKYGQKLFEQNVRTFLQFRSNVNKGLKNTIEYNPEMFFAYNNGITATASDVQLDNANNITKIVNFQIVNGAQTTSAIYASAVNKKNPIDVSKVFVQMKLSVVRNTNKQNEFVSKVSEYANTQNKINKSDFFSNSPFHKELKNYSKRIWVAAVGGSQRRTHWFYERVRGEYLNEQAYLSESEKKQFQLENPKKQFIDKKELGKSENSWLQLPHIGSKGSEFSHDIFADSITKKLEKDNLSITEAYFKDVICRIIMFKEVERLISNAKDSWYNGGYRANIVTYSISYLSYLIEAQNKYLDFNLIWEIQELPQRLHEILENIAEKIHEVITNPPPGNANASQWAKKEDCWEQIKNLDFGICIDSFLLIDKEEDKYNNRESKKEKKLDSSIEIESFVVNLEKEKWNKLLTHYQKNEMKFQVSTMQLDLLFKFVNNLIILPSPKQCKILYLLYYEALNDGVIL